MEPELLKRLHADMLRIRRVEERIAELYPQQEMRCPVHLCIGQEAAATGVCAALGPQDRVFGNHRSHGHYLAKGGDLKALLAELYGRETGCAGGRGGSMHLVDPEAGFLGATSILSSSIPIAVGAALAATLCGEPRVAVTFFGDGATEEGIFYESLNFAALKRLPVIFVCENNLYSVHSSLAVRRPAGLGLCPMAEGLGVESHGDDGNDVLAVYRRTMEAAAKCRRGEGPVFLELRTYRWLEHCGPDPDINLGYRTSAEVDAWKRRCPIARIEGLLGEGGLLSPREVAALEERLRVEIDEAVDFARSSPFPDRERLLENVYAP